jgi:hypothetical protein
MKYGRCVMRAIVLVTAIACLLAPSAARGGGFKPWGAVNGSWATYSMGDVNDQIGSINDGLSGSGLSMDEISNGFGFGITLGGDLESPLSIGVGYDRLFAGSDVSDASGSIKFDFPANAYRAFAEYRFPSGSQFLPHVGIAGGMVTASGSVELSATGVGTDKSDVSGSGPMGEFYVGGDFKAASSVSVIGSLGYRYAKIGEFKVAGETATKEDGSKATMDYSGMSARLGLKFKFMQ